jgi:hypothetical protein
VLLGVTAAPACRQAEQEGPAVATPSFSASRSQVPLGSPVDVTYKFVIEPGAPPMTEDLRVMVHFLDGDEEQLWTDDHDPPQPTSGWKPGQTVEYTRTVFVPIFPYVGPVAVHMGLYSTRTGQRTVLNGETTGQRSYRVGTLELVPRPEDAFIIYKDGWHNAEVSRDNATVEWQWTKGAATLSFRNPRRDATFYLHADARPDLAGEPLDVTLRIGDQTIDRFTVATRDEIVRKIPIGAAQFGDGESVDLTIDVSKTFVPANVPAAQSSDARELGIRVFHAHIEPK